MVLNIWFSAVSCEMLLQFTPLSEWKKKIMLEKGQHLFIMYH